MKLHVDPASCQAYGLCKEKAPDLIDLDEWGYAVGDQRRTSRPAPKPRPRATPWRSARTSR